MRIAFLTPPGYVFEHATFRAVYGGLGAAYRELGHEVEAFFWQEASGRLPQSETLPWGRLWRLRSRKELFLGSSAAAALGACDFAHFHMGAFTAYQVIGLPALRFWFLCHALRPGLPMGIHLQNMPPEGDHLKPGQSLRNLLRRYIVRNSLWTAAISSTAREPLLAEDPSLEGRVDIVPYGYDPREIEAARAVRPAQAAGGKKFILCCSRLALYKGIDVLLIAWSALAARYPDVTLRLAGTDISEGHFQKLAFHLGIADRVEFLGELGREKMIEQVLSCLFFVMPSRREAFGMAALEAMACGKAVVASSSGQADYVEDAVTGLLVKPGDPKTLQAAMVRLLEDAALRERLAAAAAPAVQAAFTWPAIARRYLSLYQERRG